jgi:hypothetical protein
VPEPIRDRPLLTLGAACIGSLAEGERMIAPLREIGEPIMDTFGQISTEQLNRIHMDPEQPVPGLGHHALIQELPDDAIDAFIGAAGPEAGSPLLLAVLCHVGGARWGVRSRTPVPYPSSMPPTSCSGSACR